MSMCKEMATDEKTLIALNNIVCDSDVEASDDERLIIHTPKKAARKKLEIPASDRKIIEDFEDDLERDLDEKAARTKLTNSHVKHILKNVITNEHVMAFVKHAENPEECPALPFEPKITRAKAKELDLEPNFPNWNCSKLPEEPSETHVLINEELPEDDSSEDEYVPGEDESEDDKSAGNSSGPPTPQSADCSTQTNWSEDGMFKIPACPSPVKPQPPVAEITTDATIALRTRSKLSLSSTPLEVIEEAFVPPDITTDMYDMECDDEEWKNFLTEFTRPLEEVTRNQEDEEHDPEYNVLADEEEVDKEEFRADAGVNITRKELNTLIGELLDYADNYNNYFPQQQQADDSVCSEMLCDTIQSEQQVEQREELMPVINAPVVIINYKQNVMQPGQKLLFEQQLRQHVQLLTQNYMLTFCHANLLEVTTTTSRYLAQVHEVVSGSNFHANSNIDGAIEMMDQWQKTMQRDDPLVNEYKQHLIKTSCELKQSKLRGNRFYVPKFHKLFLETVSQSSVFMYPGLLPRIPCDVLMQNRIAFLPSEDELISLGLEQFIPHLKNDPHHVKHDGQLNMEHVCHYIHKYMIPIKSASQIRKRVSIVRRSHQPNPIVYYFERNAAPTTYHYVVPIEDGKMLPPCKQSSHELPYQWQEYLYPEVVNPPVPQKLTPVKTKVLKPPVYNKKFAKKLTTACVRKSSAKSKISESTASASISTTSSSVSYDSFLQPEDIFASTPRCKTSLFSIPTPGVRKSLLIPDYLINVKFNSSIFEKPPELALAMPNLDTLDVDQENEENTDNMEESQEQSCSSTQVYEGDVNSTMNNSSTEVEVTSSTNVVEDGLDAVADSVDQQIIEEKDNLDDINALVVASSTIKSTTIKRRPSGLEKKRAKMKRDFADNVRLLADEETDVIAEKRNRFIQAFYDKVQENLDLDDFHRFMSALNDFDESQSSPKMLYSQVSDIVGEKHPDILDEFLLFFDALQAKQMGKLVPYLMMNNMSLFLRKLEIFFQDQPSQVRKIYRSITELSARTDVTMAQVRSTVLPLLKGNALLTEWFLQIFPMEKPPTRLLNGAWENIYLNKDNDDQYETIILPEVEDPYGGPNCICHCHSLEDVTFKARSRHCTPCGTKFMQGRVFLQTGKGLRPAKITFDDTSVDHRARLAGTLKKRAEHSPAKQISPGKDSQDETRQSSDEDGDKKQQQRLKNGRKRAPRKSLANKAEKPACVKLQKEGSTKESSAPRPSSAAASIASVASSSNSMDVVDVTSKLLADEAQEWDCNTSFDSVEIVPCSPEPCPSPEYESECCEELETSQDNNSDTDDPEADNATFIAKACTSAETAVNWSREEDKVILETFQREEEMDVAFERILGELPNRTLEQVKDRFDVLINFLKKMTENR